MNRQRKFSITLKENSQLDEVIVVGYGQQKKANVVGTITQASGKVLERSVGIPDVGSALTGNLPGVITTASSGMPGEEEPQIVIRGSSTWNNSAPLVLVDGIERPMSGVDMASVENISVLKDASATAVYGVKGANGVILITTKRGTEGKAKINASFNMTMKYVSKLPNKLDSYDALIARNNAIENELAASPGSWDDMKPMSFIENYRNQTTLEQRERYPNVDWQDVMFKNHAMSYNGNVNVSGGTQSVRYFASVDFQTIAFNLAKNKVQTEYYFDNISFQIEKESGGTIPLTPEEKRDTLIWALGKWINGMMDAVGDKVKAWDLVNEPMSDGSPYEIKSGDVEGGDDNFYWQDYLGRDYGRIAAQIVRSHENGKDAKLFVNDYNLEWSIDKCRGLIALVKEWEREVEGEPKVFIDGIGTQMHVTYSMNPQIQANNEKNYLAMLDTLVATGKLIRISELDMGITDEAGNKIMTENVTEDQHHAMANYYKFIVKTYLEKVPANQQWGICVWGVTDSPKGSGWRAGEPIGLWDEYYYRKHTYAGFADALAGE